jgi:amino acid transporter
MIVLISAAQMLLGLVYLGSSTAFTAVLSMAIIGMYASYVVPIICMLLYGRNDETHKPGPFRLGKTFGVFTNVISIIWLVFIIVFSTFPNFQPVTPQNMNYAIVVMGGWLFFGVIFYLVQGRKIYKGPAIEVVGMVR